MENVLLFDDIDNIVSKVGGRIINKVLDGEYLYLIEAKTLAQQGVRMTHTSFTNEEYLTMIGNKIVFEDGVKIFFDEWVKDKNYLLTGWSVFQKTN